jgi:Ca2+-binding RTX toxin-like protein
MRLSSILGRMFAQPRRLASRNGGNHSRRLHLVALEDRTVPTGSWAPLAASGAGPANGQMMMLLSDGSVLVQGGSNSATTTIFKLTPQANTGSYTSGVWSDIDDLNEGRLFYTTTMLPNGNVFAIGGEYPRFTNTAEVYDSVNDSWSFVAPIPTTPSSVFLSGTITGASNTTPITISTTSRITALNNGQQVTIAGVGGNTAANGVWTIANLTGGNPNTFDLVGSAGNAAYTTGGTWTSVPSAVSQFGDGVIEMLPDGQVLAGQFSGSFRYNPVADTWTATAGPKLHADSSNEETWVILPDGSILSYDIRASATAGTVRAQRYVRGTDTWVDASNLDATNPPSVLSGGAQGNELGPAFLQPDGNVIFFGANGNTAIYNPTTDLWSAGPAEPQKNLTITVDGSGNYNVANGGSATFLVGTDNPGAMLPNGHILIALSPLGPQKPGGGYSFPLASYIYEYDPVAQTFTENTPALPAENAYQLNMVVLPSGDVLLANAQGGFQVYTPDPVPPIDNSWRPVINGIFDNEDGTFTMSGLQLNGISEGANYGDDYMSSSNYPIIRFDDGGNLSYARTYNWSSTGVATGSTPVTTQFTLPTGHSSLSDFDTVTVIANGIPSFSVASRANPNVTAPANQTAVEGASKSFNLGSFSDPDGGSWTVDVNWGDGTAHTTFPMAATGSLGTRSHTYAEESAADHPGTNPYIVTVTVTDSTALSGSATFNVTVSDPAVEATGGFVVNAVEGADSGSQTVATFTDPGGPESTSDYSAVIDWGDGTATSAGTITFSAGVFTVKGNHTYAEESAADHPGTNPYAVTVTISHESSPNAVANSTAVVSDPAVIATGGFTFVAIEGELSAVQTVATFTDPGGAEPLDDYSALINWGDGTAPSVGTISFSGGIFTVKGSHTYATGLGEPGEFGNTFCDADPPSYHKPITVTISHEAAPTAQAVSDAKISLKPGTAHLTNLGSLIIVGTPANDTIVLNNVGGKTRSVTVQLGSNVLGTFTVSATGRIVVAAMGGDDSTQVAGGIVVQTVQYGGPDNDRLKGGGGRNILVGCDGDDTLTAGNLGDLLVGGAGADRLVGGNGNDILIANILVDGTGTEDDGYTDLVNILNTGSIPAPLHVQDDGAVDKLTGGSGNDKFYLHFVGGGVLDIVTDFDPKKDFWFNTI